MRQKFLQSYITNFVISKGHIVAPMRSTTIHPNLMSLVIFLVARSPWLSHSIFFAYFHLDQFLPISIEANFVSSHLGCLRHM